MAPQTAPAAELNRPHDVRQRIVRGEVVGLSRHPIQRVAVLLRATSIVKGPGAARTARTSGDDPASSILGCGGGGMCMAGQLPYGKRGLTDSAGKIF